MAHNDNRTERIWKTPQTLRFLYWTWNCWCQLEIPWKVFFVTSNLLQRKYLQHPSTSFSLQLPWVNLLKALFSSYGKGQRSEWDAAEMLRIRSQDGNPLCFFLGGVGALDSWSWNLAGSSKPAAWPWPWILLWLCVGALFIQHDIPRKKSHYKSIWLMVKTNVKSCSIPIGFG